MPKRQITSLVTAYKLFNKKSQKYRNTLFGTPKAAFLDVMRHNRLVNDIFKRQYNYFSNTWRIDKVEIVTRIVKKNVRTKKDAKRLLIRKIKRMIREEQKQT